MSHINYNCLRGKMRAFAPAAPATNPHLWVLLDVGDKQWFATINVRSDKDAPGDPLAKSYLYYFIDSDFAHPIIPSILARPDGLSPVERSYVGGALDYQRGNLFDPRAMRILPMNGAGDDNLVHRLSAIFQVAKDTSSDVFFYGNAFAKDNPHQTDAAFGYTPDTPFGIDNIHMTQGDPQSVNMRVHENGIWHDGGCLIWDPVAKRMSAIFLSFQSQAWHTNDNGDLLYGVTGCEAPLYDFSGDAAQALAQPAKAVEMTSLHRGGDGAASLVVTNMSAAPIDLTGWRVLAQAQLATPLPAGALAPAQPLSVNMATGAILDGGGILTLVNDANLRVDGVAYRGGDAIAGWSTSFAR